MSETGARPWWADVEHLRPREDREREQWARDERDAALGDVRALAEVRSLDADLGADGNARFGRHADLSSDRDARFGRDGDRAPKFARAELAPVRSAVARVGGAARAAAAAVAFAEPEPDWEETPPRRELHLVVEEPLPAPDPAVRAVEDDATALSDEQDRAGRTTRRRSADDWLALVDPDEHRDPDNGRRTIEIRGQVDAPRGVAKPDEQPVTRNAGRRPGPRPVERIQGRPDRIAMWAFVLGVVLIIAAAISAPDAGAATRLGERDLKAGMEGRDVRHLQLHLKRAGLLQAPATARFGSLTRRAVRRYQRSRCLTVDGIAGRSTIRAIKAGRRPCRRETAGGSRSGSARASRSAYRSVGLGARTLARGMRGSDVRTLQSLLGLGADGVFGSQTKRAVRRFQRRANLTADGAVGPATRSALAAHRMRSRTATWYGPGLYGRRTACGQRLTRRLRGVAHKKLPCGTRVLLSHGGRFVTARVVDRGPFVDGVTFDLTAATARQLGLRATARIAARY